MIPTRGGVQRPAVASFSGQRANRAQRLFLFELTVFGL
jgi:hypothetical protein